MTITEGLKKNINELYLRAGDRADYHQLHLVTGDLEGAITRENVPVDQAADALANGYWARYHEMMKFGGAASEITDLRERVSKYYDQLDAFPDLKVVYGYLLTEIFAYLEKDKSMATKISTEISKFAEASGSIVSALRTINAEGTKLMADGRYGQTIKTLRGGFMFFNRPEKTEESHLRHFGNIFNNLGLAEIRLAGQEGFFKKRGLVADGIDHLEMAFLLYSREVSPPVKHLGGIRNRLKLAWLESVKCLSFDLSLRAWRESKKVGNFLERF